MRQKRQTGGGSGLPQGFTQLAGIGGTQEEHVAATSGGHAVRAAGMEGNRRHGTAVLQWFANRGAVGEVPQPGRAILAPRQQLPSIGTESKAGNVCLMDERLRGGGTAVCVPELHRVIPARGKHCVRLWGESDPFDNRGVRQRDGRGSGGIESVHIRAGSLLSRRHQPVGAHTHGHCVDAAPDDRL